MLPKEEINKADIPHFQEPNSIPPLACHHEHHTFTEVGYVVAYPLQIPRHKRQMLCAVIFFGSSII